MNKTLILRRQRGIAKHFDLRLAGLGCFVVYADHIETPLARRWEAAQIFPHDSRYLAPLVPVDGRDPGLYVQSGSRLHLHKAEDIVFPSDEIDFSPAARRAVISRHHGVAQLPQMKVRRFFSALAGAMMRGQFLGRQRACGQPVQEPEHGVGGASGKRAFRE